MIIMISSSLSALHSVARGNKKKVTGMTLEAILVSWRSKSCYS